VRIRVEGLLEDVQRVLGKLRGESVEVFVESNTHSHAKQSHFTTKKAKKAMMPIVSDESILDRKRRLDRDRKRAERAGKMSIMSPKKGLTAHGEPVKPGYWGRMTPKQRSEEMEHRRLVAEGKAHPRPRQYNKANFPLGGVA
jgi:hypothetical protein